MPRPRITIRTMMIVVAAMAIGIVFEKCRRRWVTYHDWYRTYARLEVSVLNDRDIGRCFPTKDETPESLERLHEANRASNLKYSAYFKELKEKYARAMYRPWVTVAPDAEPDF